MGILRRKKIKKHINSITYVSIFLIVAIIVTVSAVGGREQIEFMEMAETETYIVDVVSKERVNLSIVEGQEEMPEEAGVNEADANVQTTESEATSEGITTVVTEETVTTDAVTTIEETTAEEITVEETSVEETTEDISKYKGIFVMNTSGNLNIRSKGDSSSEVIGVLTEGNGGEVVKYGTHWTKVKSGNVTGYVATEYILIGDRAEKALKENGYIATVNTDTLLVRTEKNTDCEVLGMAANGSEYQCTKVYKEWVQIIYEGQKGYLSRQYVDLESVMTYARTVAEIEAEQMTEAPAPVQNTTSTTSQQTSQQTASKPATSKNPSKPTTTESTKASYSDKYLLACLVACEAGGESYEGKLAVASVVLNRVRSSVYPSSIESVIYQSGQFGPASNGSLARMLKNGPDSGSQKAANAALAGTNNVPGYLYFGRTETINLKNLKSYRIIDHQVYY